ncbi:MAG: response regulator transcription factor [Parasulfuritortus sp.]|jgi:two-component system NarL family response regulator|nr:response regulator transcription factor [Parasulfuritortus sp.]
MTIQITLADDHRMFREALRHSLATETDIEIVAEAGNAAQTLESIERDTPDVLVLDIALPDGNGIDVARQALVRHPRLNVVALSGYADRLFVEEMMKAGARGYVVKSAGTDELLLAIRSVVKGHIFLSPEVTGALIGRPDNGAAPPAPPLTVLTSREQSVLRLLAKGRRSNDTARELGISPATVDVHRRNIKRKLQISSIAELTRYAVREGLLSV